MKLTTRSRTAPFVDLVLILWITLLLNQLLFGATGFLNVVANLSNNVISKRWLIANLLKYLLNAGQAMLFIWIGHAVHFEKQAVKLVVKGWLTTVLVGIGAFFGWMSVSYWSGSGTLWQILLPVLRNSYPLLTSAGVSILMAPMLTSIAKRYRQSLVLIVLLGFGLPMVLNQDLWAFNGGLGVVSPLLLTAIGSLVAASPVKWSRNRWRLISIGLVFLAGCSMLIMIPISGFAHQNISTVTRFVTQNSLLTVGLATAMFVVLMPIKQGTQTQKPAWWSIQWPAVVVTTVLLGNPTFNGFLQKVLGTKIPELHKKTLPWLLGACLVIAVVTAVVTLIMQFIFKTQWWRRLTNRVVMMVTEGWTSPMATLKKVQKWLQAHRLGLWTTGLFYGLALLSILLMNTSFHVSPTTGDHVNIFLYTILFREPVVWLNVLFIAAFFGVLIAITNRYWVSMLTTTGVVIIIIVANMIKIRTREEPILPADMAEIKALGSLLKMVGSGVLIGSISLVIVVIAAIVWLEWRGSRQLHLSLRSRGLLVLIAIVTFGSTLFWNHDNLVFKGMANAVDDSRMFYNQELGAQINGPIIQFLNNVDVSVMPEPDGYSKATIDKIVRRYQHEAVTINRTRTTTLKNQTVIMNLSESFSDPNRVPNLTVTPNPMPYITELKKQTTAGLMLSSGYGGGTANMEYQSLTGLAISNFSPTLPTPYTQLVTTLNQAPALTDQFNYSAAIHPYYGIYYNRIAVYKKFGFNKFSYLGSNSPITDQHKIGTSDYLSDETAYANTLNQINARKGGQFINLVTMQNHYPFTDKYPDHDYTASGTAFTSDEGRQKIETYAQGLSYTDAAVKTFKEHLDQINKPIVWVWYGDHLAGLYDGDSMAKYGLQLHETDYFIYANKYSREHGYKQTKDTYVSPSDFPVMAMDQANAKVSPYYALLTRVHQQLPALTMNTSSDNTNTLNSSTQFVDASGHVISEKSLTKHQRQLLHDYRLIQYDIVAGKQYALKTHFMK